MFQVSSFKFQGFSIIEILIMISLLVMAFVAILGLATKTLRLEQLAKNDFIAQSLANEGFELVEEIRNANLKAMPVPRAFYSYIGTTAGAPAYQPLYFRINIDRNNDFECGATDPVCILVLEVGDPAEIGNIHYNLHFDSSPPGHDYYHHDNDISEATDFYRQIKTVFNTPPGGGAYLEVVSTVYWQHRGKSFTYKVEGRLYDEINSN